MFVNAGYGYDIRGEVVCENGTVALAEAGGVTVSAGGRRTAVPAGNTWADRVPADWRERFVDAYDTELQDWLTAVAVGTSVGPGAWDGYAAAAVTDSAVQALRTGQRVAVSLPERPEFYAKPQ